MNSMIEEKMKLAPLVSTGAMGEMILYQDMIVLNKVSEETIGRVIERLKEQFPSVKYFLYADGIFFRMYQPDPTSEMKKLVDHVNDTKAHYNDKTQQVLDSLVKQYSK